MEARSDTGRKKTFPPRTPILAESQPGGDIFFVLSGSVVVYRTEVHFALRNLTTRDWGRSTDHLGWDMKKWWAWYNEEYVPYKRAQASSEATLDSGMTELMDRLHENAVPESTPSTGE